MQVPIRLRPATLQDAELLLAWRNDLQTRLASHGTHEIPLAEHWAWLDLVLADPARRLLIAELDDVPVGSIRVDTASDDVAELSWTVAPSARGQGVGTRMLIAALSEVTGSVRAEVKIGNVASMKMAEAAGLVLVREEQGVLHYQKCLSGQARSQS
ncbi:GNAT family N-acetyltransferase [Uliginosibacterium sp. H3]|uniref:GNAT family N-acetyltransferase n=1 Tax=Uliginosibacterium silvisoli TaxID=3114758 RepID=A0ABU6K852_9RHOO|nr:GNAT family N-acetyltransferase [Uliginosibacterium sp. H3]